MGKFKGDILKVLFVRDSGKTRSNVFKVDKFRFKRDTGKYRLTNNGR